MDKGLIRDNTSLKGKDTVPGFDSLVLDKDIFSKVFEKDIRRIYIYKKSERIAKAIHMVSSTLKESRALKERLEDISLALIDAAVLSPSSAREEISRELLSLASLLSVAKAGGHLSPMNADIIMREAHNLLQEVAIYEDPHLFLEEAPTLTTLARAASKEERNALPQRKELAAQERGGMGVSKGQVSDSLGQDSRKKEILAVLESKGQARIKDISMIVRSISEKTIQRELQALVNSGQVYRMGERRWTIYGLSEPRVAGATK